MEMRNTLDLLKEIAGKIDAGDLAMEALDVAVAHIQDKLGQEYGDTAGIFFTGRNQDVIIEIFKDYIEQEKSSIDSEDQIIDEYLDDTAMTRESFGGAMTSFRP
jgi:hypothetical protein